MELKDLKEVTKTYTKKKLRKTYTSIELSFSTDEEIFLGDIVELILQRNKRVFFSVSEIDGNNFTAKTMGNYNGEDLLKTSKDLQDAMDKEISLVKDPRRIATIRERQLYT